MLAASLQLDRTLVHQHSKSASGVVSFLGRATTVTLFFGLVSVNLAVSAALPSGAYDAEPVEEGQSQKPPSE